MNKLRCDSMWNELTEEQWQTLEGWLFEENIGFNEAVERLEKEWGMKRTRSSVVRFRQYCAKERAVSGMAAMLEAAKRIDETGAKLDEFRASTLKVMSKRLFEQALDTTNLKELTVLGRLMSQSEEREIRHRRLALARERWEFKASKAALKALPELNNFAQEEEKREMAKLELIKRKLFGKVLHEIQLPPEKPL